MRAVLDPNVIISGLISRGGAPVRVLLGWRNGLLEVFVSPLLLEELRRALAYPKLRRHLPAGDAEAAVRWLSEGASRVTDAAHRVTVRSTDPGDDYLIALAAANKAVLVSGDKHLLALRDQIPVYSPRDFLEVIEPG